MADPDPLLEARVRAKEALRADPWPSVKVAAWVFVFGTAAASAVAFGLFDREFISRSTLVWLLAAGSVGPAFLVYFAQELRRLYERSAALKDLFEAQRQYEVLLRQAWDGRDQLAKANAELMHENAALRSLATLVTLVRASRGETDRD